jgi:rare lipoprotein A (peptidoglycan hydrolase)
LARTVRSSLLAWLLCAACGTAPVEPETTTPRRPPRTSAERQALVGQIERGLATWYGAKFDGKKTASGERFDKDGMTAAHRTLPFGTRVRVTNDNNRLSVVVRINDRGPFGRGRVIDLSRAAADKLDMLGAGVVPVTVEVLSVPVRKR